MLQQQQSKDLKKWKETYFPSESKIKNLAGLSLLEKEQKPDSLPKKN